MHFFDGYRDKGVVRRREVAVWIPDCDIYLYIYIIQVQGFSHKKRSKVLIGPFALIDACPSHSFDRGERPNIVFACDVWMLLAVHFANPLAISSLKILPCPF